MYNTQSLFTPFSRQVQARCQGGTRNEDLQGRGNGTNAEMVPGAASDRGHDSCNDNDKAVLEIADVNLSCFVRLQRQMWIGDDGELGWVKVWYLAGYMAGYMAG